MDQSETLLNVDMSNTAWDTFKKVFVGVVAGLAVIAIVIASCGLAVLAGITVTVTVGSIVLVPIVAATTGVVAACWYSNDFLPPDFNFPLYSISAEEIFRGDILLFDVDFFNPKEVYAKMKTYKDSISDHDINNDFIVGVPGNTKTIANISTDNVFKEKGINTSEASMYNSYELTEAGRKYIKNDTEYNWGTAGVDTTEASQAQFFIRRANLPSTEKFYISWDEVKNYIKEIPLSANSKEVKDNLENVKYYYYLDDGKEVKTNNNNTAAALRSVVSKWYNALRNIAVVLMLSILLYIGIRMLLSTLASDKAKYKQMLMDWLIGMCLLFFMHYIMAFSVTLTKQFIKVINSTYDTDKNAVIIQADEDGKIAHKLEEVGRTEVFSPEGADPDDVEYIVWPTNLMGRMRIELQMQTGKVSYVGYAICFMILVFYTVFFCFTYLKRVIYMAFLTIISPLVAMTYPIDKMNDGQAQAFNKWLKEYLFNLLIQPLHLLLYTMLVSSAIDFAGKNTWYMICAIGFLVPAEKLLRSFFGFEKATTPGSFAGVAVGAGLVSRGIGGLLHKMPGGPHIGHERDNGKVLGSGDNSKGTKMRFSNNDFDSTAALAGGTGLMAASTMGDVKPKKEVSGSKNKARMLYSFNQANLKNAKKGTLKLNKANTPLKANNQNNKKMNAKIKTKQGSQALPNNNKNRVATTSNSIPKRPKRIRRAVKAGGRVFTRNVGRKIINTGGKAGKTALKFATGVTLGGVAGTIGVAAGIATGDASNALQYGAAGAGAGMYAGSKAGELVTNTAGYVKNEIDDVTSGTKEAAQKEYYGEEYKQRQQEKQIRTWKKDKTNRYELEAKVGREAAKSMYDNGEIDDYLRYEVDDVSDMVAIHKLQEEKIAENREQAVAVHKYAQRTGDTSKMKKKDKDEWKNTFKEEFKKIGRSELDAEKASKDTFNMIEHYNKIRTKL